MKCECVHADACRRFGLVFVQRSSVERALNREFSRIHSSSFFVVLSDSITPLPGLFRQLSCISVFPQHIFPPLLPLQLQLRVTGLWRPTLTPNGKIWNIINLQNDD